MKIVLTMIVRNEEALLAQALRSVSEIVDEMVVVDTGSTDETITIAKRHGARVYEHPWEQSFSIARNQAFDHARELNADWFFILDADEEFVRQDAKKLREYIAEEKWNGLRMSNINVFKNGYVAHHHNVRAAKNIEGVKYVGRAHNFLLLPEPVLSTDIRIKHYGYDLDPKYMEMKYIRSAALMIQDAKQYPQDARIRFHTALMLDKIGNFKDAVGHVEAALKIWDRRSKENMLRILPTLHLACAIYFKLGKEKASERYCRRALSIWPEFADSLFMLGLLLAERPGKEHECVHYLNRYKIMDNFLQQNPQPGYAFQCLGYSAKADKLIEKCKQRTKHSMSGTSI